MKQTTELLSLFHVRWCRSSVNGNPRWCFLAKTPEGNMREFRTSTDNGWAYGCDIGRMTLGTAIRVTYHATRTGNLIATHWDDGRATGTSLATELDALIEAAQLRVAVTPAHISHEPVRL